MATEPEPETGRRGRRHRGARPRRVRPLYWFAVPLAIVAMVAPTILGISALRTEFVPGSGGLGGGGNDSGITSSLLSGGRIAVTPATFWGLNIYTTCSKCIVSKPSIGQYLNSTAFTVFRDDANGDSCNVTSNTVYSDSGQPSTPCAFDLNAFKTWCYSKTPHCHAIISLPGENNNSKEDAYIANYIVHTLNFLPDYFFVGNEPMGWTHYGIAWKNWKTTDHSSPTPLAYAFDVKAAIQAIHAVVPLAKFIGLQAACQCNTQWYQDVAKIDGSLIGMMAYHTYPSLLSGGTTETEQTFLDALIGTHNLTTSYGKVRAAIAGQCGSCATMPISIGEYNAGPGWSPSNWGGTHANAVFLAASTIQALRANVSQFDIYDLQSGLTTSGYSMMNNQGVVSPNGLLFSKVLSHLNMGSVYNVNVLTTVPSVWSVLTKNGVHQSLLIVNANLTHSITIGIGTFLPLGAATTVYSWPASQSSPTTSTGKLLTTYTIGAQGILLLDF